MSSPTLNTVHQPTSSIKPLNAKLLARLLQHVSALMSAETIEDEKSDEITETTEAEKSALQKPYSTEHAARQHDPKRYTTIRRKNNAFGPGIHVIYGILPDGKTEVQSIRFAADKFTSAQAQAWLKAHDYQVGSLEVAASKADSKAELCANCGLPGELQDYNGQRLCQECVDDIEDVVDEASGDESETDDESKTTVNKTAGDGGFADPGYQEDHEPRYPLKVNGKYSEDKIRAAWSYIHMPRNAAQYNSAQLARIKAKIVRAWRIAIDPAGPAALTKVHFQADIIKADDEQRLIYAIVYAPKKVDSQGDFASLTEITKMAHRWLTSSRRYDLQHQEALPAEAVVPVESYLAPVDFTIGPKLIKQGTWIVVSHIPNDQLWTLVKNGLINSYSICGYGKRTPVTAVG